jgi:predicted O-methyltransferase YrrM
VKEWIERVLADKDLRKMGHGQRRQDLNLGLGWLYYGLARAMRPATVLVIGSWRGFVPLVFGRALQENAEGGRVVFVDPSLVDDFWKNPDAVRRHFECFDVHNVRHFLATTQEFVESDAYRTLGEVTIGFVDGDHSLDQLRIDHDAVVARLAPGGLILFHDSANSGEVSLYGRDRCYRREVAEFLDELRPDPGLQVLDLPVADGVSLVRRI